MLTENVYFAIINIVYLSHKITIEVTYDSNENYLFT